MENNRDKKTDDILEKLVHINRITKVVKGGRRFGFAALVITGNQKGQVGFGQGKAKQVPDAIKKATENATRIAHHFEHHKFIEKVLYPGLASHPGHAIQAAQRSRLFGGMMSVITTGTKQTAIDVARYCNVFYPATSLGGVESLIEHRATVSGEDFPVHPNLLRLSIGIEHPDDIIADIKQALAA